jgi:Protein of unknown function (DUF2490)
LDFRKFHSAPLHIKVLFRLLILPWMIAFSCQEARSETGLGNWNALIFKSKFNEKWSMIQENHFKSADFNLKYDYYEVKETVYYAIRSNLAAAIGSGLFHTCDSGTLFDIQKSRNEFRTWEELNVKHSYDRFGFEHRGRLEQRFLSDGYQNRFRFRIGFMANLNQDPKKPSRFFLSCNNELYIPLDGIKIEKNRLFTGAGLQMNHNATLSFGRLSDTIYNPAGNSRKSYLYIAVIYNLSHIHARNTVD